MAEESGDIVVECGECRRVLDESSSVREEDRQPCQGCGSLTRHIQVNIGGTLNIHSDLAAKAKRGGQGTPFLEQKVGDDFHHASGTWRHREMVVDREKDRYRKVVTDPASGEELYRKEEPLSEHTCRGSAKKSSGGQER